MSLASDSNLGDTFDGLDAIEEILGTEPTASPPRLLIVDDEPYVLRAIKRVLGRIGIELETAESGVEALERLAGEPFDVIISDQSMPGMSGVDLLERVRTAYPNVIRVMLTGNNDLATAVQAINKGDVFRFLHKPWENEELVRVAELALEQAIVLKNHERYQRYIREQNDRLRMVNDELERRVAKRTKELAEGKKRIDDLYRDLDRSFDTTIQILLSSMELGDIAIVDHCRRTAVRVQQLADEVELAPEAIPALVRAGLLHWIGLIGAPPETMRKDPADHGSEEAASWEFHPLLCHQLLQEVSALRRSGLIVLHYLRSYDDDTFRIGAPIGGGEVADADLVASARILGVCSAFERARTQASNRDQGAAERLHVERGLEQLRRGTRTRFDPALVSALSGLIERIYGTERDEIRLRSILELKPDMVLSRPLETLQGIPIAPRELRVTSEILKRLNLFQQSGGLGPIFVWSQSD